MDINYGLIIGLITIMVIGVPFTVFVFHTVRRLRDLHNENRTIEGELFVTDDGELYSEFGIDYDAIKQRDTILLKVHHIKSKEGKTDE